VSKRGRVYTAFQPRYFVLERRRLLYFKSRSIFQAHGPPQGSIERKCEREERGRGGGENERMRERARARARASERASELASKRTSERAREREREREREIYC
jgi:hypothetical protein